MYAGSPTAGSSSSFLSRPDNEFETDTLRRFHHQLELFDLMRGLVRAHASENALRNELPPIYAGVRSALLSIVTLISLITTRGM